MLRAARVRSARLRRFVLTCLFLLPGCTQLLVGDPMGDGAETEYEWGSLHAIDLTEVEEGLASSSCTGSRTFEDFSMASSSSYAVLAASLCESWDDAGTPSFEARPWGRIYLPVSTGGAGWAEAGRDHASLTEGAAGDRYRDLEVTVSPTGMAAVLAWDFDSEKSVSAFWNPDSGWLGLQNDPLAGVGGFSYFDAAATAGGAWADPGPESQSRDGPLDFIAGREKALTWDSRGRLRFLGLDSASLIARGTESTAEDAAAWSIESEDFGAVGSLDAGQVRLIDDGLRTIALWTTADPDAFSTSTAGSLYFATDENGFRDLACSAVMDQSECEAADLAAGGDGTIAADSDQALNPQASEATLAFGAATDSNGTVVAAYLARHGDELASTCSTLAQGCNHRLYASVHTQSGDWIGPTPLDESFALARSTTTHLQDSGAYSDAGGSLEFTPVEGGLIAMEPQVAHVGGGRFLVVWAISDYTDPAQPFTQIHSRGYTVGEGWDSADETVEVGEPYLHSSASDGSFGTYRPVNRLKLAADASIGRAILVTQETESLETDPGTIEGRNYIHAVYQWDGSAGWGGRTTFENEIPCPILHLPDEDDLSTEYLSACGGAPIEAAVFPSGEAVVVFPMPREPVETEAQLGLFSVEFTP